MKGIQYDELVACCADYFFTEELNKETLTKLILDVIKLNGSNVEDFHEKSITAMCDVFLFDTPEADIMDVAKITFMVVSQVELQERIMNMLSGLQN